MDGIDGGAGNGLEIEIGRADGACVIKVSGEMDLGTVEEFEGALSQAQATDAPKIVVDLSELAFIDSSGLRVLLAAEMASREDSDRLWFLPGGEQVTRVMRMTGVDSLLRFVD